MNPLRVLAFAFVGAVTLWANPAFGTIEYVSSSSSSSQEESNRMRFRRGLYGSFMMEPLGAWGFHFAYRSNDYLRFTGGLGVISPGYSKDGLVVTGGPKWMIPGWNFTPVIGTNLQFTVSTTQPFELAIFENIGVEYTSLRGFHIGIGLGVAYLSTQGTQYLGRAMPYFNMGYFF